MLPSQIEIKNNKLKIGYTNKWYDFESAELDGFM
jgi:hypothetical protein